MNTVFSTILFILPGIVSMLFTEQIGKGSSTKLSDYQTTLYGIALSIPIMFGVWGGYNALVQVHTTLSTFLKLITPDAHAFWYLVFASAVGCLYGLLIGKVGIPVFDSFTNWLRGTEATRHSEPVWETFTGDRKGAVVKIYKLGEQEKAYFGVLKRWSSVRDNENGLLLTRTDELKEIQLLLDYPCRSYFDKATSTVYEYFDEQQVQNALEQRNSEEVITSSE